MHRTEMAATRDGSIVLSVATGRDTGPALAAAADAAPADGHADGRADRIRAAVADGTCLIARDGDAVVGLATHDRSLFGHPYLALVLVRPAARRRGVGTALVQAVVAGVEGDRVFSSVRESNVAARMLLGRLGFVASGFIENLTDGDPELVYVRLLGDAAPAPIPVPAEAPD